MIGISQKKDIKNLYVHVMADVNDDDRKSILQFFSAFFTKPNFINSNLTSKFITRKMIDIEIMNNKLYSKKPHKCLDTFSKYIHEICDL